jgi:transcriptional regulator
MADAPPAYTTAMLEQIVGIELPIARLVGKFKASQNRRDADRAGAIAGLRETGEPGNVAMAALMEGMRHRS